MYIWRKIWEMERDLINNLEIEGGFAKVQCVQSVDLLSSDPHP